MTSSNLPIFTILDTLLKQLRHANCFVLQAEPGAGKSTQVPLALLKEDWLQGQKIILLEPRRIAAKSIAFFLAKQLGEKVGQTVGYQVKNDRKITAQTRLEIITEGILTRRLQSDPELTDTALVIFDEFHERSLQADLALALCLESQTALREDLKILIMSATLDRKDLSEFLGKAPHLFCEGRHFPVETNYLPTPIPTKVSGYPAPYFTYLTYLTTAIFKALARTQGNILIFLPGQNDIFKAIQHFKTQHNTASNNAHPNHPPECLALYGGLNATEQEKVMQPSDTRRIIFSTNLAETSLTLPNITAVIDTGLKRQIVYDPNSGLSRLETQKISQASADQRKGRAGRVQAGICYRLWTETEHSRLPPFDEPEILQSDLSALCLELAVWGEPNYQNMRWLTPPPQAHINQATTLLKSLNLLKPNGTANADSETIIQLGIEPRLGKILLASQHLATQAKTDLRPLACDIASLLSERDILLDTNQTDFRLRLEACHLARKGHKTNQIHQTTLNQVLQNSQNWLKKITKNPHPPKKYPDYAPEILNTYTGILIAFGFQDRIAQKRPNSQINYRMANGKGTHLPTNDALKNTNYLAIAALEGHQTDGRIYLAAPISLKDLKTTFANQLTPEITTDYLADKNTIKSHQTLSFKHLILSKEPLQNIPKEAFQTCLKSTLIHSNLALLNWTKNTQAWLKKVRWLANYCPALECYSEVNLLANIDTWLLPYLSNIQRFEDLKTVALHPLLLAQIDYPLQQSITQEAPDTYTSPNGKSYKIHYEAHRTPYVSLPLQAVLGETTTPKIAFNQVPLTFELLSPAKRPLQVTQDLANFWHTSYLQIAKEMRGRYPKHNWPENAPDPKSNKK